MPGKKAEPICACFILNRQLYVQLSSRQIWELADRPELLIVDCRYAVLRRTAGTDLGKLNGVLREIGTRPFDAPLCGGQRWRCGGRLAEPERNPHSKQEGEPSYRMRSNHTWKLDSSDRKSTRLNSSH